MPLAFPTTPTNGQIATVGGVRYTFDTTDNKWKSSGIPALSTSAYIVAATTPTARYDGSVLVAGDQYFNTIDENMYIYDGTSWIVSSRFNLLSPRSAVPAAANGRDNGEALQEGDMYYHTGVDEFYVYTQTAGGTFSWSQVSKNNILLAVGTDPTQRNNGRPLLEGDTYFNTTTNVWMTFDGAGAWVNAAAHADTSTLNGVQTTAGQFVNSITVDSNGHVTAVGTAAASGSVNYQVFTANGTWTKPTGVSADAMVYVEMWGGGGGGSRNSGSCGGGGGGFASRRIKASSLGATVAITVGGGGAGATVSGNSGGGGGNSSFGTFCTAYGGGGGGRSSWPNRGGQGGGHNKVGATSNNDTDCNGGGEGGGEDNNGDPLDSTYPDIYGGGGGGGGNATGAAKAAVFGGGGGGGSSTNNNAAGVSKFGGNGGAGNTATGGAGTAPGGGGGAGITTGGAGARGEVRVWTIG